MILLGLIVIILGFLAVNAYIDTVLSGAAVLIVIVAMVIISVRKNRDKSKIEENKHMENKPDDDINIRFDS